MDVLDKEFADNSDPGDFESHDHPMKVTEESAVKVLQEILKFTHTVSLQQFLKT